MSQQPPPRLDVDISIGDEDVAEARLVRSVNDLINGKAEPSTVAKLIDDLVTDECQKGLARYEAASADEKENVDRSAIGGWLHYLYVSVFARGAMMVPAEHPAQDQLVRLVQELNRLPAHAVPQVLPDGRVLQKEIWNIVPANDYNGFRQWLWEITQGEVQPYGKAYDTKYFVNLSAFLARMLASGTAAMLGLCSLLDPFARRSLVTVASQEPGEYAYHVAAASQWILHAGEAVRELCQKRAMAGKRWSPDLWNNLKTKFNDVARDSRFTADGCAWAARARDHMAELEQQDFSGKQGIVEVFHFQTLEEDKEHFA